MSDPAPAPHVTAAKSLMQNSDVRHVVGTLMERHGLTRMMLSEADLAAGATATAEYRIGLDEGEDFLVLTGEPSGKIEVSTKPGPPASRTVTAAGAFTVVAMVVLVLALFTPLVIRLWSWALS